MSSEIIRDIGEIYTRLFDHRPFLSGEVLSFVKEFEEKRGDREVENLFTAIQTTTEISDNIIKRCFAASETNLPNLKLSLNETLLACNEVLDKERDPNLDLQLEKNRETRKKVWQDFIDDMTHKCSRIDLTFEEKEEEISEFYSDLERKLHIHK